jgi:hypothetical protein
VLAQAGRPLSLPALEPLVELRRTRLETMLKVLDVDGAVKRVKGGWIATGEPWVYDSERYAWVARQRSAEQQAMRDYATTTGCRMEFLRRQLDDEEAAACGRPVIVPDNTCHTEIFGPEAFLFRPDGVKVYPEGDWISDWYKGQLFSRFGKPSVRRLAELLKAVSLGGPVSRDRASKLQEKIVTKYTWDAAAACAAERLLEVQR